MGILTSVFKQAVSEMTYNQRKNALNYLLEIIDDDLLGNHYLENSQGCCPFCNGNHTIFVKLYVKEGLKKQALRKR